MYGILLCSHVLIAYGIIISQGDADGDGGGNGNVPTTLPAWQIPMGVSRTKVTYPVRGIPRPDYPPRQENTNKLSEKNHGEGFPEQDI